MQGRNHASKVGGPNRAKPEKERGEPLPGKVLEFRTSNRSVWCTVERELEKIDFSKKK